MAQQMEHRGPDDSGWWLSPDGAVGLSHRRLSIVDLSSAGRQPMSTPDGKIQVVFNGEIYNFLDLRRWLECRGHRFRTDCDTEVLLYLYRELGDAMVDELDGDFGFGLWDEERRRLLLARDRAGVKPLYFAETDNYLIFGSEIKAILATGVVPRELNEESLYHYLTYLMVPPPHTLFEGISKLSAGSFLTLELGGGASGSKRRKYWEPLPDRMAVDEKNLDEQLRDLFERSLEKRLMSDVPVGVLFSGGVDSTLNTVFFQQLVGEQEKVRSFTVGVIDAPGFDDESESARKRAEWLGTAHHEVKITEEDLLKTAIDLAHYQDEPVADPVCVPFYFVTKLARESGTIVLQSGEGADEILCGYDNYRRFLRHNRRYWRPLSRLPRFASWPGYAFFRRSRNPLHLKMADVLLRRFRGQELFMSSAVAYYENEKSTVLGPQFKNRHSGLDSFQAVEPLYRRITREFPEASFLQRLTYLELQLRLPELLLMRVDKMSMANSVEVRVPFLDRDLIDFSLSVPDSFKLRDGISKEPLKRLAADFVPRETVYAPKKGFGAPIQSWFRTSLGDRMRDILRQDSSDIDFIFDLKELERRLDAGPKTVNQAFQLWVVFNFLLWRQSYLA